MHKLPIQKKTGGLDMSSRRDFLKTMAVGGIMLALPKIVRPSSLSGLKRLVILHSNDTHSQIEPLPKTHHRFPGMGGYAVRSEFIKKVRAEGYPLMVFDSGDIFQGTPYYNMYKGEVEMRLMSEMGYTAATIGNHEFDGGLEGLASAMKQANFDFISSNYHFNYPEIKNRVKEYKVYELEGVKIGVFGLGVKPYGLIGSIPFGNTGYSDPVEKAAEMAYVLKNEKKCDIVVCLSHLGFKTSGDLIGDFELAKQSKNIDLILGGHSHTLLKNPVTIYNSDKQGVLITQNAYAGVRMTRLDCFLTKSGSLVFVDAHTTKIFKNQA